MSLSEIFLHDAVEAVVIESESVWDDLALHSHQTTGNIHCGHKRTDMVSHKKHSLGAKEANVPIATNSSRQNLAPSI